jgi:hypothetical protein
MTFLKYTVKEDTHFIDMILKIQPIKSQIVNGTD